MNTSNFRYRMERNFPKAYFTDIAELLHDRGWTIDRVTVEGRVNGVFLVTDEKRGHRLWDSLQSLKLHIIGD